MTNQMMAWVEMDWSWGSGFEINLVRYENNEQLNDRPNMTSFELQDKVETFYKQ